MEKKNNLIVKDFITKYKAPLVLTILTVLIFLSFIFEKLVVITSVVVVFAMVFCSLEEQICLIMYLAVFSGKSPIYIISILFCFVTLAVKYVFEAIKKEKPVFKFQLILTSIIVVIFSIVHYKVSTEGFYNWAMFVCLIFFTYFAVIYHKEISVDKSFKALILAIFVSAALGVLGYFTGWVKNVYYYDDIVHRLRLFTLNVNHLAMFCMFAISYLLTKIMQNDFANGDFKFLKDKKFWLRVVCLFALVVIGLFTMSKAFLLVSALAVLYMLITIIVKYRLKSLWFILVFACLLVVVCLVFKDYISSILSRFVAYDSYNELLSKMTTGRSELWVMYLKDFSSSVWKILFGVGLLTTDLIAKGPHNVFIYFLYRVGVLGVLMLILLIITYANQGKGKLKINLSNVLLLAVYLFFALEELVFSDRFFLFLVFGVMMLVNKNQETQETNAEENLKEKQNEDDLLSKKTTKSVNKVKKNS